MPVEALPGSEPTATPEPSTPETPSPDATQGAAPAQTLPDPLVKLPAFQALMTGNPAAVSLDLHSKADMPEGKLIAQNKNPLTAAGFQFYRSLSGRFGVIYNSLYLNGQELLNADKMGKLNIIAPPYDVVAHAISKSGATNPVLRHKNVPQVPKPPVLGAPPQSASMPGGPASPVGSPAPPAAPASATKPIPASAQGKLMNQRSQNLNPGGPLTGPSPGAGRIQNEILKPVV